MARFLIVFSYDGSNYKGYQKQKNKVTIQGKIEEALKYVNNGIDTKLVSSGRTDAFVHANNQYAHADIYVDITEEKLKRALNSLTPKDIYIKKVMKVDNHFHARFMVKKKQYIYILNMGEYNPIKRNYEYQYCKKLDLNKITKALNYIVGIHDFQNLSSNQIKEKDTVKEIYEINVIEHNDKLIFSITGNGFLRYMVRVIVGILIQIGESKYEPEIIIDILNGTYIGNYKKVAPAVGLYLNDVEY